MGLLDSKFTFRDAISWGAANTLGEAYIKRLFGGLSEASIREVFDAPIHPHFKTWLLLRPQFLTSKVLHEIATDFAETYYKESRTQGVYTDFRYEGLISLKRDWIANKVSTGNLRVGQRLSQDIVLSLSSHSCEHAKRLAYVIRSMMLDRPFQCLRQVYSNTADFSTVKSEQASGNFSAFWVERIHYVRKKFEQLESDLLFLAELELKRTQKIVSTRAKEQVPGAVPIGTVIAYAGQPELGFEECGWMICDGRELVSLDNPELFEAIGIAFGSANGLVFNIPDLRGLFVRGVSGESSQDPDKNERPQAALGGASGNAVGSFQDYATARPQNSFTATIANGNTSGASYDGGCQSHVGESPGSCTFPATTGGGLESRPKNKYVYYIIKYKAVNGSGLDVDIPVGAIVPYAGVVPSQLQQNWLLCDGSLKSNLGEFKALFQAIGFAHGGASEESYKLPDYRGFFLRGVSPVGGQDPGVDSRGYPNPDAEGKFRGNDKGGVGSVQDYETAAPHTPFTTTVTVPYGQTGEVIDGVIRTIYDYNSGAPLVDVSQAGGDSETRPINRSVEWYIRFR